MVRMAGGFAQRCREQPDRAGLFGDGAVPVEDRWARVVLNPVEIYRDQHFPIQCAVVLLHPSVLGDPARFGTFHASEGPRAQIDTTQEEWGEPGGAERNRHRLLTMWQKNKWRPGEQCERWVAVGRVASYLSRQMGAGPSGLSRKTALRELHAMTWDNRQRQTELPMWSVLMYSGQGRLGYDVRPNFKYQLFERIYEQGPEDMTRRAWGR